MTPCTSAAPFSSWHRMHGQAIHEWGYPTWVPWWEARVWQAWSQLALMRAARQLADDAARTLKRVESGLP